jgi:hypothetical protein
MGFTMTLFLPLCQPTARSNVWGLVRQAPPIILRPHLATSPRGGRSPYERFDPLCLPRTKSGSIDDEVRRGSAEQRVGRAVGSADGPANPCPETGAFGIRCNSRRRRQEFGAMGFAEDDDVIEAFSTDRANQPLRMSILPR